MSNRTILTPPFKQIIKLIFVIGTLWGLVKLYPGKNNKKQWFCGNNNRLLLNLLQGPSLVNAFCFCFTLLVTNKKENWNYIFFKECYMYFWQSVPIQTYIYISVFRFFHEFVNYPTRHHAYFYFSISPSSQGRPLAAGEMVVSGRWMLIQILFNLVQSHLLDRS